LRFLGANPDTQIERGQALSSRVNYLLGRDPANWHVGLPTYTSIGYRDLYRGVRLDYSGTDGHLKGTYTLAPGADPRLIRWRYAGAQEVTVDGSGNLQITAGNAKLTEAAPVAWQVVNGQRVPVSARYVLDGGTIAFALGAYDAARPLIIDPTITYSTYLGGFYGDGASSIALDAQGYMYVTGSTTSADFPVAGDPFQPVYGGQYDAFVSKLSPDGSSLIYSTFLGGDGQIDGGDFGDFISVDAQGNVIVAGSTDADNFPTTPSAYQTENDGSESLFISKLDATGSRLIFSTYWGSDGVDEPYGFAVDGAGNTYFTGYYFPGFSSWAFVAAVSHDGSQQLFRTPLGGSQPGPGDENANTSGEGITVDGSGNIYVTGYTRAADFPVTSGAYRTSIQAYEDGFITKLAPLGASILYSTYIPGGVSEYPADIAVDHDGNAYITGQTSSSDYPTTPGAFRRSCGDPRCAIVTKLNASGSALVYSSLLGGPDFHFDTEDYGFALRVDAQGNAYVGGYTSAPGFPVVDPIQATLQGPFDAFLTKFNPSGSGVEYSTYIGGRGGESAGSIALDIQGNVYLAGATSSTDFPLVAPYQSSSHGGSDASSCT